ncbi:hypothetical protein [Paenibacillus naphthalenovorans]|nr:hypothetical protein [Paenibacillus naphthalenovorans]
MKRVSRMTPEEFSDRADLFLRGVIVGAIIAGSVWLIASHYNT